MSEHAPGVVVVTVTFNEEADLPGYFAALAEVSHRPLDVVLVDCGSNDNTVALAERLAAGMPFPVTVLPLGENRGFSGGMNAGIAASRAPYVLSLNTDARPTPDYVSTLVGELATHPRVGAATGRLLRWTEPGEPARLDACGMRLTWTWRHLDRGSDEIDRGQYSRAERVFGATGAAALFRREALLDVAVNGEVFDERFHTFREDAELAFRLAERRWEVVYQPAAVAHHRRNVVPARRSALSPFVNYHSLKNRYLLRANHQSWGNFLLTLGPTLARDLGAFAYVLVRERSSLPAYTWLWRHRREILARRRTLRERRTAPPLAVTGWFFRDRMDP